MASVVNVTATGNPEIDGLLSGVKWTGTVTFSFPDSASDYERNYGSGEPKARGFQQISAAEQAVIFYAVNLVESYTLLDLSYAGTNGADIRIAMSSAANPTSYAYYPGSGPGGDVWIGTGYSGYRSPKKGDYYFDTHLHEFGHALGLKHSQEKGGPANVAVPSAHDDLEYTVMSYRSYVGGSTTSGYTNEAYGYPTTYMINDILALQTMYGANYSTNSGDTVYTWNPATGEYSIDGVGQGAPGANRVFMSIWDGGGNDTYDLSNYTTAVSIDLNPGGYTITSTTQLAYLGSGHYAHGNVYNAYLYNDNPASYIENAIGGSGNDTLVGNAVANRLDGGAGNDTLTGNGGNDVFVYEGGADTITDFAAGGGGGDQIDLTAFNTIGDLSAVLALATTSGNDTVIDFGGGNTLTLKNVLPGDLASNDFIFAVVPTGNPPTHIDLSTPTVVEGAAVDTVVGTLTTTDPDSDTQFTYELVDDAGGLFAIDGDQVVVAGTINYETASSYKVTVLVTDPGHQTYTQDITIAVTDVAPTTPADTNVADNKVAEGSAAGTAVGITASSTDPGGGPITYTLTDDAGGLFQINPTTGVVTVAPGAVLDYDLATSYGITVQATDGTLDSTTTDFTIAVTEVTAIPGVTINGSSRNDTIDATHSPIGQPRSTANNDTIKGNGGNDTIAGLGGADAMDGGAGTDTATYAASSAGVTVSLATGTGSGGDAQGDTLLNFENLTGSSHDDVLEGNSGNNVLDGGSGIDTLSYEHAGGGVTISLAITSAQSTGGAGKDTIKNFENLTGSAFNDKLTGSNGNNVLSGLAGNDTLNGGNGNDKLIGGPGNDTLTGGSGNDAFVFNFPNEGVDTITDFKSGTDWLEISASGFGGNLSVNGTPTIQLVADLSAASSSGSDGYFILDKSGAGLGSLYWDPTGGDSTDAVKIAILTNVSSLQPSDIHIV